MEIDYQVFTDAAEHAVSLRQWNQNYQQITKGEFRSSLLQLNLGEVSIFREQGNQRVTQQGHAPADQMAMFGLLAHVNSSACFQGKSIGPNAVLGLRGGGEFMLHLPAGVEVIGMTMTKSAFNNVVPMDSREIFGKILDRQVIYMGHEEHFALRSGVDLALRELINDADQVWTPALLKLATHRLLALFVEPLFEGIFAQQFNLTQAVRCEIVNRCRDIAMCSAQEPVTVLDLCSRLKISPRTLHNSFLSVTGTAPATYLRSVRLAEVRKLLKATPPEALSISDAAAQWGFSSVHFAADYKRQYGELPSKTQRKR